MTKIGRVVLVLLPFCVIFIGSLAKYGVEELPSLLGWGLAALLIGALFVLCFSFVVQRAGRRARAALRAEYPGALLVVATKTRSLSAWLREQGIPPAYDPLLLSASSDEGLQFWAAEDGFPQLLVSVPAADVDTAVGVEGLADGTAMSVSLLRLTVRDVVVDLALWREDRFRMRRLPLIEAKDVAIRLRRSLEVAESGDGSNSLQLTNEFWGEHGRVGLITRGDLRGRRILAYPDTLPEWWCVIVEGDELDERLFHGNEILLDLVEKWGVEWLPFGAEEMALERELFGWRPLTGVRHGWLA